MAAKYTCTPDWKEQRRWRAFDLKRDGWTHHEIAEALAVTKGAVSQWMTRAAKEGDEALRARPHLGAAPTLTHGFADFNVATVRKAATVEIRLSKTKAKILGRPEFPVITPRCFC